MKIRSDYKICEYCGASLDVGEKCDCEDAQRSFFLTGRIIHDTKQKSEIFLPLKKIALALQ